MKIGGELTEKSAKIIHHGYCESDYKRDYGHFYSVLLLSLLSGTKSVFSHLDFQLFRLKLNKCE